MASTSCEVHPFEQATGTCRTCGDQFCADCLVYSHGEKKPPFCIPCALTAAGVRSTAGRGRAGRGSAGRILVGLAVFAGVGAAAVPVAMALV